MATVATARAAFEAFREALERRDIEAVVDLYTDDAAYISYSERSRPASAEPVRGKAAIAEVWRPVAEQKLTESFADEVIADDRFACTITCTYPTGERVVANHIFEVRDGKIVRETATETWDE